MQNDNFRKQIITGSFLLLITSVMFAFVIAPRYTVSKAERRRLESMPKLTFESISDKTFMDKTEKYLLDHFPLRNGLRRVKAYFAYDVLQQKENNDIYIAEGYASKLEYPLKETSVNRFAEKITGLRQQYFPNQKFYYAIIPDKNYFLAAKNGYPSIDYGRMQSLLADKLTQGAGACYIDVISGLSLDDYYHTDTHWRQERLFDTANTVMSGMGNKIGLKEEDFEVNEIKDFYGVYYGQAALPMEPDTIVYLTNEVTDAATVWSLEENYLKGGVVMSDEENAVLKPVYRHDKLEGEMSMDKYDLFVGGASSMQIIKSPKAAEDKRLIIFRDSYTSSLVPLLLGAYREIVLIDLRYINSSLLGDYVDFADADILFLYNTSIVNQSEMLK